MTAKAVSGVKIRKTIFGVENGTVIIWLHSDQIFRGKRAINRYIGGYL